MDWISGIIAMSAIIAMASVLLVFQVGQPRIWMSMSRDGLLPPVFSRLHPKFKTPSFSTIITGILVAVPSLFMNLTEVTDLTSIGTLFAFVLVSGGVLITDRQDKNRSPSHFQGSFRVPYLNSRYWLPVVWLGVIILLWFWRPPELNAFFSYPGSGYGGKDMARLLTHGELPVLLFALAAVILTFFSIWKQFSLIPVMGLLTNLYLMAQLGITNWLRFIIWLVIGLVIYFSFSRQHSRLRRENLHP